MAPLDATHDAIQPQPPPPRPRRRWLRLLLKLTLLLAVAVAVLYVFVLPRLVEQRILAGLRAQGIEPAPGAFVQSGLRQLVVGPLQAGGIEIDSVVITYDLASLSAGRARAVVATGVRWPVTITGSGVDLHLPVTAADPAAPRGELPFDRVELRQAQLIVDNAPVTVRVTLHGRLSRDPTGALVGQFQALTPIGPLDIDSTIDAAQGRVRVAIHRPRTWPEDRLEAERLTLTYDNTDGPPRTHFDIALDGSALPAWVLSTLQTAGVSWRSAHVAVTGELDERFHPVTLEARAEAEELVLPQVGRLSGLDARIEQRGGLVTVHAQGRGETWKAVVRTAGSAATPDAQAPDAANAADQEATAVALPIVRLDDDGGWSVALPRLRLDVSGGDAGAIVWTAGRSVIDLQAEGRGAAAKLNWVVHTAGVEAAGEKWSASLPEAQFVGSASRGSDAAVAVTADLAIERGSIHLKNADLMLSQIALTLPLRWNAGEPQSGTWSVGRVALGQDELPEIRGTLSQRDRRADLTFTWTPLPGAELNGSGDVEMTPDGPRGQLVATIPRFVLDDAAAARTLVKRLGDWNVTGAFALDAKVQLAEGRLTPLIRLDVADGMIASATHDASAERINGSVTLDGFTPLSTSASQKFEVGEAHMGSLHLLRGDVAFKVDSADAIFVERARWTLREGGRFVVHAFRVNPSNPVVDTEVFVEDMDLQPWLSSLTSGRITGSGRIYGRLPVRYDPRGGDRALTFAEGFLYATPDAGKIVVQDREMLREILEQGAAQGKQAVDVNAILVEALSEFEYSQLRFDFLTVGEQLVLRVGVSGRGVRGSTPVNMAYLTINITGIEPLLNQVLLPALGSNQAIDGALQRMQR